MAPSIRARLALWYSVVMAAVLVVVAVAVSSVHNRLGLARLDAELSDDISTIAVIIQHEIDERDGLREAVAESLEQFEMQGTGAIVVDAHGQVLGARQTGVRPLPAAMLSRLGTAGVSLTSEEQDVRARAAERRAGGEQFRIIAWIPLAPFERERATVLNTIAWSLPIALLVAATGGWVLASRALRPLALMAAHADRIDHRRLQARLPIANPRDELGRLGLAFNAVLERLDHGVQAQRRFMADASHELRTPVSVARTAAQVTLGVTERAESDYRESLAIIATQTQRMSRLVDDMFMLALADMDARPLDRHELYLDDVLKECVRAAQVLGSQRGVAIAIDTTPDLQMRGDEALLRQLFMNLLENAIRHTGPGTHVRVTLRDLGDRAEVVVEDDGPGVRPEDRERIFDRFVRIAAPGGDGGAGLGLPIARWIAESHGGSLTLDPSTQTGSRFVLLLPTSSLIA